MFHGAPPLYIRVIGFIVTATFAVMGMVFATISVDRKGSIIALIVDSPRRTWHRATMWALFTDLNMGGSRTSTPSAASPASAEACMAVSRAGCGASVAASVGAGLAEDSMAVASAAGSMGVEVATGNRIRGEKQFLSKKTGMEVS
jgi:hypothetical protein